MTERDKRHKYMLLARLEMDCEYFLGNGNGSYKHLYYPTPSEHIEGMKKLWNELPEKPQWLTMEKINIYEFKMVNPS